MSERVSEEENERIVPLHGVWARGGPVFAHLTDNAVHAVEGRAMASFGDAAALGMWAFATGALMSGLFQAKILPLEQLALLFPQLLVYSGAVLFIAGLFLFRRNNSFLATSFCSFGAFNLTRGLLILCESKGWIPNGASADLLQGILIEVFAYVALSLFVGALAMNTVVALVMIWAFVGFALSGLPFLTNEIGHGFWGDVGSYGGYALLATAAFAYYGGTAMVVNTAFERVVLPIGGKA
ncbi:MAG TPA: acetate uptake transporter [Xanthobacteraceae bacterium]|nr:acetate uptake transporter [Xanthobacteraceae bacterium]